jgi:hypothetical protein
MNPLARLTGRVVLLTCTIAILAACSVAEIQSVEDTWVRYVHQNGLSLCLPDSLTVEKRANGFSIYIKETKEQYRLPLEVNVSLQAGEIEPQAHWLQSWPLFSSLFNNVHYRVEEEEGGSGGVGYRLTAWQKQGDGYIVYQQVTQADGTSPDFSLAWQVIKASGSDSPCTHQQL